MARERLVQMLDMRKGFVEIDIDPIAAGSEDHMYNLRINVDGVCRLRVQNCTIKMPEDKTVQCLLHEV